MSLVQKAKGLGARPLIRVKIWGNLGDQLFQYALAIHLKNLNAEPIGLNYEEFWHFFRYANVGKEIQERIEPRLASPLAKHSSLFKILRGVGIKLFFKEKIISETFLPEKRKFAHIETYSGHFRDAASASFAKYRPEILDAFDFSDTIAKAKLEDVAQDIQNSESIGIHLSPSVWVEESALKNNFGSWPATSPESFYRKSIEVLREKLKSPKFFIFTEDPKWCQTILPETQNMNFVPDFRESSLASLQLLTLCKHQILPKNSFAWWAAWLNRNAEPTILTEELAS